MSVQDDAIAAVQTFVDAALQADAKRIDDGIAGLESVWFKLPQVDVGAAAWVPSTAKTLRAALRDFAAQLKVARQPSIQLQALIRARDILAEKSK